MKDGMGMGGNKSNRRSFLKKGAFAAGAATAVGGGLLGNRFALLAQDEPSGTLTPGDAAILRFLFVLETIESDLWRQYSELGGATCVSGCSPIDLPFPTGLSGPYISALENLDGDMPQYIADNTDDEFSHAAFLKAYLDSKGADTAALEAEVRPFFTLPPSSIPGVPRVGRLTNLTQLTVDTSWWTRYRSDSGNPDLGDTFDQAVPTLFSGQHTAIPRTLADTSDPSLIQAIANTAAFHFAFIEQGGSSLYPSLAQRARHAEVLRILLSIGPTETSHFQTWHDKAGNAVSPMLAPLTVGDLTFPNLNATGSPDEFQTNLIMPEPTKFLKRSFPAVSIIRPTETEGAAMGAVNALTADGLFIGQPPAFFQLLQDLAGDADRARR